MAVDLGCDAYHAGKKGDPSIISRWDSNGGVLCSTVAMAEGVNYEIIILVVVMGKFDVLTRCQRRCCGQRLGFGGPKGSFMLGRLRRQVSYLGCYT